MVFALQSYPLPYMTSDKIAFERLWIVLDNKNCVTWCEQCEELLGMQLDANYCICCNYIIQFGFERRILCLI